LALAPAEAWPLLLVAAYTTLGFGLAGTFFVALQYVTGSSWSIAFRRVPEALSSLVAVGAVGMALVLLVRPDLYPAFGDAPAGGFRGWWLNRPFFLLRAFAYAAVWIWFGRRLVRHSRAQDDDGDPGRTAEAGRTAAAFIVCFAVTFWLASADWIMSLEPHWYSTMFGLYNFAGFFLAGLALVTLLTLWLERVGPLSGIVTTEHLHDLGRLMFGFSTFWMYIWFCQYMLIWYVNIPEETSYYIARLQGTWMPLVFLTLVANWGVPFLVLLPRAAKRNRLVLAQVGLLLLIGRWLDVALMVLPSVHVPALALVTWGAAAAVATAAVAVVVFRRGYAGAGAFPRGDPWIVESLEHHA
jgi:hypothetical protein